MRFLFGCVLLCLHAAGGVEVSKLSVRSLMGLSGPQRLSSVVRHALNELFGTQYVIEEHFTGVSLELLSALNVSQALYAIRELLLPQVRRGSDKERTSRRSEDYRAMIIDAMRSAKTAPIAVAPLHEAENAARLRRFYHAVLPSLSFMDSASADSSSSSSSASASASAAEEPVPGSTNDCLRWSALHYMICGGEVAVRRAFEALDEAGLRASVDKLKAQFARYTTAQLRAHAPLLAAIANHVFGGAPAPPGTTSLFDHSCFLLL
jgi:hypothetical protein